ncbi:MAG: 4-hydroxy-tetrahydrodipicolinate synthase [Acutalibacteraceae bacterium]|jgi:4-hydroxy-tetrahydrodipicolinate synthase|nr:4-hydroxy-tetrahydrodipicolinate synthase [Clostridiales bacterium]
MKKSVFTGAGVAIVTPFGKDGKINYDLFGKLIDRQIENNTDAIIVCGTTGESPVLDHDEHAAAIDFVVSYVGGRVPVVAGTGSNDTAYGLRLSNEAEKAGADALLMVTPYYNKTSQNGLIKHYNYIADRVSAPIILYNVPSRTGVDIKPETYLELSKHERIVATKEANGNIAALAKTISLCGDNLDVYSGNDDQITAFMSLGAKGVISVISNVIPKDTHDMVYKYLDGDVKASAQLQLKYMNLCSSLFMDVNPIPVKEALVMMGFDVGECRMPLAPLSDCARTILENTLKEYGLI